jgi:hypothetical protein
MNAKVCRRDTGHGGDKPTLRVGQLQPTDRRSDQQNGSVACSFWSACINPDNRFKVGECAAAPDERIQNHDDVHDAGIRIGPLDR